MVTQRDVADLVGVSPAVVSAVIAGSRSVRVSEATKAKVLEAVARTGYRTNHAARALAVRRSGVIAAVVPKITNPIFDQVLQGVQDAADADHGVVVLADADRVRPGSHLLHRLAGTGMADGFLMRTESLHDETLAEFVSRGIPCVVLGPRSAASRQPHLWIDDRAGIRAAVGHLFDHGHHRVCVVGGQGDTPRRQGFADALAERGRRARDRDYLAVGYRSDDVYDAVVTVMGRRARPTGVVIDNATSAAVVLAALTDLGLRVPHDLSVIAYHDIVSLGTLRPEVSAVRMPLCEAGKHAYRLLRSLIDGTPMRSRVIAGTGPDVVARSSVIRVGATTRGDGADGLGDQ